MKSKYNILPVFIFTLIVLFSGCSVQKKHQKIKDFSVVYHYDAEVSYYDARISGTELTYTFLDYEAIRERCEHWIKQMPCWTSDDLITVTKNLSQKEAGSLIDLIEASGIKQLDEYYGPEEGMRCYPYTLKIKLDGQEKQVVYCSRPDGPPEPEAFKKVKAKIMVIVGATSNQ